MDFLRICYRYRTEREIKARPKIVSVFNVESLVCVFWVRDAGEGAGVQTGAYNRKGVGFYGLKAWGRQL